MGGYIARRLAVLPFLVLGLVTIVFFTSRLLPANPIVAIVGARNAGDPAVVAAAKDRWGLNGGVFEQYGDYLRNVVHGDLGISFVTQTKVWSDLGDKLPATLELAVVALIFGSIGGVALGMISARRQNSPADHASRLVALLGSSLPVFWIGARLAVRVVRPARLVPRPRPAATAVPATAITSPGFYTVDSLLAGNLPCSGSAVHRLVLPCVVLGWGIVGHRQPLVRAAMLDEIHADYVRTARAKGLAGTARHAPHVLRNALLPMFTILGLSFAQLLTAPC